MAEKYDIPELAMTAFLAAKQNAENQVGQIRANFEAQVQLINEQTLKSLNLDPVKDNWKVDWPKGKIAKLPPSKEPKAEPSPAAKSGRGRSRKR